MEWDMEQDQAFMEVEDIDVILPVVEKQEVPDWVWPLSKILLKDTAGKWGWIQTAIFIRSGLHCLF